MNYELWIKEREAKESLWNKCAEVTTEMVGAFPELIRVRGHVTIGTGHMRPHWWCRAEDGRVIDPTVSQFTDPAGYYGGAGVLAYNEHRGAEPTGKCPNCGEYSYNHQLLCSPECESAYTAYVCGGRTFGGKYSNPKGAALRASVTELVRMEIP